MLEVVGQFRFQYSEQDQGVLGSLVAKPSLFSKVIDSKGQDAEISSIKARVKSGTGDEGWAMHANGSLWYKGPVVVPWLIDLREEIIKEFHCSRFTVHPGGRKMYRDLHPQYY